MQEMAVGHQVGTGDANNQERIFVSLESRVSLTSAIFGMCSFRFFGGVSSGPSVRTTK